MKKLLTIIAAAVFSGSLFAGGLVTNTNQSAAWIRMPVQDAGLGIDAAYFNPAGLSSINDGFHLSLSNQFINQKRTITSTFPGMNLDKFVGTVEAPLFPSAYAVYKKNKLALSFGFNIIGGGGSAFFEDGLPSFEMMVAGSNIPGALTASGIPTSKYLTGTEFDGQSMIMGFQLNGSYAVTENLSASLGLRYLTTKNTYKGYLDILINPNQPAFGAAYNGNNMVSAPVFFEDAATALNGFSTGATALAAGVQPIINGGFGGVLVSDGTTVGLTAEQVGQMTALISAAGQNPVGMNIQTAQAVLNGAAPVFLANSQVMAGYALATADKNVDATQTGTGFAPIIGLNYKVSDNLNIAVKYEHRAKITLTNETVEDDVNLYPDGVETASDMPAMISVGVSYKPLSKLSLSAGYHSYLDKGADYGKKVDDVLVDNSAVIDKNFWEAGFGAEYELTDRILVSAGYLRAQTGVNDDYQSDFSHSLSTNSIGLGGRIMVNEMIGVNLGFMKTMYESYTKVFTTHEEKYERTATVIALGVDLSF